MSRSRIQGPKRRDSIPSQTVLRTFLAERHLGGLFYHCQLAKHLIRVGFEVKRIEKENNHAHVWVLKLRRGWVPAGREVEWLQQQVCMFLRRHGLRYPKREVCVMVQGVRIKAAFNWSEGKAGWIIL